MTAATLDKMDARAELSKFLQLAEDLGPGLKMFSGFIDAEWHRLIDAPETYAEFCTSSGTRTWEHVPNIAPAIAVIEWIGDYEQRWGNLPPAWFANESGTVDQDAYRDYLDSHQVVASWDCSPSSGSVAKVDLIDDQGA